ncbi:MAG: lactate dehydrogenase, partial [Halobacteriales archaeon]|nr:lactate dehydrogenase [Halobacteriales archaeon]
MEIAIVGGAGTIGATTGYDLAMARPDATVSLIDVRADLAEAHATDIRHARAHVAHSIGRQTAVETQGGATGTVRGLDTDAVDRCDPDVVVVAASAPRPDISAQRGGRIHYLEMNREVMDDVAAQLRHWDQVPAIVVTNPLDRMTDR